VELGSAPEQRGAGEWSWPPEAPVHPAEGARFLTDDWAPASTVRHPWVRVGRWTLLYRRHHVA
jgi:hypothetical protein